MRIRTRRLGVILLYGACLSMLGCGRVGFELQSVADAGGGRDAQVDANADANISCQMDDAGACDPCPLDDPDDSDHDGTCDSADLCPGEDDRADADGDGFPDGCDSCGDGVIDTTGGETCDPGSPSQACPRDCDDAEPCTQDAISGSAASCNVVCTNIPIAMPFNEDGCCPAGANNANDSDCQPQCGNAVVEAGESCDPESAATPCPADCDDGDGCTVDGRSGMAATCDVMCTHTSITILIAGDMCCPTGANNVTDSDCSPLCGNATVEANETCDPPSSCPSTCDDGDSCTTDVSSGSPQGCDAACSFTPIELPFNGDACCPPGANSTNDSDCTPACGNGVVESGEECDGGSDCSAGCRLTDRGQCLAFLGALPNSGLGDDACSQCACSSCTSSMLDCYRDGNASRDQNCPPVAQCALDRDCVGNCNDANFGCYGEFCWWGGNYPSRSTGPCKNPISAAAGGSTNASTVQSRSNNSSYPLYWAEAFGSCLQSRCRSQCNL